MCTKQSSGKHLIALVLALLAWAWLGPGAWAQTVTSLICSPSVISGGSGASAICAVTLSTAAPAGGTAVALTSSLPELAAPVPAITVPAGQTAANFTVATNAKYRRYSGLAFAATITASANGTSRSAALSTTAQARPTDVVRNPDTDLSGLNCAGEPGILFDCQKGPNSTCTFKQECTLGCLHRPQEGTNWKDVCATTGPFPISLSPRTVVGGNSSAGTLLLSAPAPAGSFGLAASSSLVAAPENRLNMPIPTGATSLGFKVLTAPVNAIQFANMDAHVTTPEPHPQGGTFFASRHQRTWLAVAPGTPPPVNLSSLTLDIPSLRGGLFTAGTACIDQLKPAPEVGDVPLAIASSNPAVATIGLPSFPQGGNCSVFGVQTAAVAVDTLVTITATLGAQSLSVPLTVTATPLATRVNSFFLDPLSVVGGNSSIGTIVLNGLAPAGGAVVSLTGANPAVVILPATVTVAAGTDRVSFAVLTTPVAASTSVTLSATYGIGPSFTSLTVLPAGPTLTLSSHTLNPTSVASGGTSTGTVTLSGAVPAGSAGAVVTLSSQLSAVASVPPSATVPAGASSASYAAIAGTVSATSSSAITANFGGTSLTATLTVSPAATGVSLSALALNPTSVVGGASSTGTVTLSAAAPSGGAVVSLSDNSAAATVPASVTVAAGATSASFTASTGAVAASTVVTVTATFAGVSRTATLTVNPAATGALPAPTLLSPADDARFQPGASIRFDWSDVAGAAFYTIEFDDSSTIAAPLVATQSPTLSETTISSLPTRRMWWRVRAHSADGTAGAWSAVRRFEIKQ